MATAKPRNKPAKHQKRRKRVAPKPRTKAAARPKSSLWRWMIWGYGASLLVAILVVGVALSSARPFSSADKPTTGDDAVVRAILDSLSSGAEIPLSSIPSVSAIKKRDAWQAFAAPPVESSAARLVLIIDDIGLDRAVTRRLSRMAPPLVMAFLPYAEGLSEQSQWVKNAGHETFLHLPMQPTNPAADPGPHALLHDLSAGDFAARLDWNFARLSGFVGVNNHMGSLLTEKPLAMVRVMGRLNQEGLIFVDSLTSPNSVAGRAARATGVPFLSRDIFIDNERDISLITAQLEKAERIALRRGWAIAIGHPYPETLDAIDRWRPGLSARGIVLVPVSQVMQEVLKQGDLAR